MNRKILMIAIFAIALAVLPLLVTTPALACNCVWSTTESGQKLMDEAFFIGRVKVMGIEHVKDAFPEKATLEVVEAYYKASPETVIVDNNPSEAACGFGPLEENKEYEVIILERQDGSRLIAGICNALLPAQWDTLREKAANRTAPLQIQDDQ